VPVRSVSVVELRHRAVLAVVRLGQRVEDVAVHFEVHPDTVRRWVRRFMAEGLDGLVDRSRVPHRSPGRIDAQLEDRICRMRQEHPHWGARRIRAELARAGVSAPAKSTIERALRRNGLLFGRPRKRQPVPRRFVASAPNALWQIDAWECALADGTTVDVIDIVDDHARVLLAAQAVPSVTSEAVWAVFSAASAQWGLPQRVLSDNATYLTGRAKGAVAEFERRLWRLGIATSNGGPYHPQTQGKIERFHRTARAWLDRHGPPETIEHLQTLLDELAVHYNYDRPHQGLNDQIPIDVYRATEPAAPLAEPPCRTTTRQVLANGTVSYSRWRVNLGSEWIGLDVDVIEQADKIRIVYAAELITTFSAEEPKGYIRSGQLRSRRPGRR
jgi:transposase InsO family protein